MRKNEDKLIHKIGRGVVTGVMTTSLVLTGTPALLAATQTVAMADETAAVAKIGDTEYSDLAGAFNAVTSDANVIDVQKDASLSTMATITKDTTINLNGHSLDTTQGNTASLFQVIDGATLTINGSGSTITGRLNVGIAENNNGNIILNGGAYQVGDAQTVLHVNGTCKNSNVTIKDATITSPNDNGIQLNGGGTFSIQNSSISGKTGVYQKAGKLTLNNSTISGTSDDYTPASYNGDGSNPTGDAIVLDTTKGYQGDIELHVQDGNNIVSRSGSAIKEAVITGGDSGTRVIEIADGNFQGPTSAVELSDQFKKAVEDGKASVSVAGGTFSDGSVDPYAASVIEVKSGDVTKHVVGNSIESAANNAKDGDTITVTKTSGDLSLPQSGANVINNSDAKVTVGDVTLEKGQALWGGALSAAKIDPIDDQQYTGNPIEPKPTVVVDGKTLAEGTDYDLEYKDNKDLGTATITIKGKGNYAGGQAQVTFDITEKDKLAELGKAIQDSRTVDSQIDKRKFSGDSVKAFEDAIAAAEKVQSDKFSPAKDIEDAQAALTDAYDKLAPAQGIGMYRLYNPNSGEHFYTGSKSEHDHLVDVGWSDEGTGWVAPASSNTPVYRLYNPNAGDHHYTTSASERDTLIDAGWNYEGIGWFSDDDQKVPLYRQYNPNAVAGAHNFTTSKEENDHLVSVGWRAEGIGWYGINASAAK